MMSCERKEKMVRERRRRRRYVSEEDGEEGRFCRGEEKGGLKAGGEISEGDNNRVNWDMCETWGVMVVLCVWCCFS